METRYEIIIFLFFATLYFILSPKLLLGSNDGSHYVILEALLAGDLPGISKDLMPYMGFVNFAVHEDDIFSDRPPGVALLAAPIYLLAKVLSLIMPLEFSPTQSMVQLNGWKVNSLDMFPFRSFAIAVVHLVPILMSAASTVLVYRILRLFSELSCRCFLLSMLFGLGTVFSKYATVFYASNVICFFVLWVIYLMLTIRRVDETVPLYRYMLMGFLLGFLALLQYQLIIFGIVTLLFIMMEYRRFFQLEGPRLVNISVAGFSIMGLLPVLAMGLYQYEMFGDPLKTTYSNHGFYLYAHNFWEVLSGNPLDGLHGLLFSADRNGLFYASPFILLGAIFALASIRRHTKEKSYFIIVAVSHIIFCAFLREWHGGGFNPRYIVWSAMLLCLGGFIWVLEVDFRLPIKFGLSHLESVGLIAFSLLGVYSIYVNIIDFPAFFSELKSLDYNCIRGVYGKCSFNSYLPGLSHWPLLLIALIILYQFSVFLHWRNLHSPFIDLSKNVAVSMLAVMIVLVPLQSVPSWQKQDVLVMENFYGWGVTPSNKQLEESKVDIKNLQANGQFIYPTEYDVPGKFLLPLPPLDETSRVFVEIDATISKPGNRITGRVRSANGGSIHVIDIESVDTEVRHHLLKEFPNPDPSEGSNTIEIEILTASGSVTLFDARLEYIKVFTTR